MVEDDKKAADEGVYKVETVPPPPGEADAYNAPTKVGPIAPAAIVEMMRAAEEEGRKARATRPEKEVATLPPPALPEEDAPVPRVYDDEEDEATLLGKRAGPPPIVEVTAPLPPELFAKAREDAQALDDAAVAEVEALIRPRRIMVITVFVVMTIVAGFAGAYLISRI